MSTSPDDVTELLNEWAKGDRGALERLMPLVYAELHRMAEQHMRRQSPEHTLQTTGLIHEAYLRMAGESARQWKSRSHFYGVAAKAMRHVLVDHARKKHSAKRGGGWRAVTLDEGIGTSDERLAELIAIDEALANLARLHQRQSEVVELRFFGGLGVEETAEVLKVSPETVALDWRAAKAWLHKELAANR
jgi:RNA polymerase sigma factor (TIGR02999 family)